MNDVKLAIVITCYNYAEFVGRAIDSVVSQNRPDCEIVVVDDGSTDKSWDVISARAVKAFRIENSGQRQAALHGLDQTTAPFVLFLDADDELTPGSIATIIEHLDPLVAKLQFCLMQVDVDGKSLSERRYFRTYRSRSNLMRQVLRSGVYRSPPTSGNVFRRDVCEFMREANYERAVDGVILFVAPFLGDVVSIQDELGLYRIHDRNDSGLGRAPDIKALDRDLRRFEARMEHLRDIIRRLSSGSELLNTRDAFYFRERSFCLEIMSGHRPSVRRLFGLLIKLGQVEAPLKSKLAMAAFFLIAPLVSHDKAKALLAYRLQVGQRSPFAFLKQVVGIGVRPA